MSTVRIIPPQLTPVFIPQLSSPALSSRDRTIFPSNVGGQENTITQVSPQLPCYACRTAFASKGVRSSAGITVPPLPVWVAHEGIRKFSTGRLKQSSSPRESGFKLKVAAMLPLKMVSPAMSHVVFGRFSHHLRHKIATKLCWQYPYVFPMQLNTLACYSGPFAVLAARQNISCKNCGAAASKQKMFLKLRI